jgi:hypothetical protein
MESMDNLRERFEALEQRTESLQQHTRMIEQRRWWRGGLLVAALVVSALAPARPGQAADFACTAGDVACLIDAITTANANGDANTITLEAGTYTLTAVDNTTEGAPNERNGLPSITSTLTVRGADPDTTILERAASAPAFRLLHIAASGTLTLEGLTVQGGLCATLAAQSVCLGGGGLRNLGTVTLRHSVVRRNLSSLFSGGGGGLQNLGTATLTHCTVSNNEAIDTGGGGIENVGTLTIDRCTVTGNATPENGGGGLANRGSGTLLLTASTLTGNGAGGSGGGLLNGGTLVVLNSTLTGNGARGSGGGLLNTTGGTATVLNSTLAENTGGGIGNGGTVVLLNTLLAHNTPGQAGTLDCSGPITSLGHNLVGDPTGCTLTLQPTDLTGDPGLDTFTDDGTPGHGHFPLLPTSQAIDAGNDAVCPRTDQLGQRRIGPCDIGAIRFLDPTDVQQANDAAAAAQATK